MASEAATSPSCTRWNTLSWSRLTKLVGWWEVWQVVARHLADQEGAGEAEAGDGGHHQHQPPTHQEVPAAQNMAATFQLFLESIQKDFNFKLNLILKD